MVFKYFFPQNRGISKEIFWLAYPVIISNLSRVLMSVFDVAMVGRLGAAALAATGMGGMLFWGALSLTLGIRTAVQTVASRRLGQKLDKKSGTAFHNGIYMATAYAVPVSFFGWAFVEKIVPFFVNDAQATPLAIEYTSIVFLSLLFSAYSFVFQGFYTGIEKTKIHMKATLSSNLVNLYLNFGLIFGTDKIIENLDGTAFSFLSNLWTFYHFPELGVKGAAIGTMFACIWLFIHYFIYLFKSDIIKKFNVLRITLDKKMFKRQIEIASPVAIQETLVALSLAVFYKLIAIIGIFELAATQVVFRIMHASFMPAIGVGQACSTLVGKFLGEKNPEKAETAIYESLRGSFLMMGFMGICFVCFADYIIPVFTNDINVINIAVPGLKFVGFIQFVDAICFTLWFALTGAGDTKVLAIVDILSHWILFIPMVYILGIILNLGYWGAWIAFAMHLTFIAGYTTWRFKSGKWKKIVL